MNHMYIPFFCHIVTCHFAKKAFHQLGILSTSLGHFVNYTVCWTGILFKHLAKQWLGKMTKQQSFFLEKNLRKKEEKDKSHWITKGCLNIVKYLQVSNVQNLFSLSEKPHSNRLKCLSFISLKLRLGDFCLIEPV